MTLLNAHGLTKAYGDKTVLDAVSLSLAEGERVGLVGVNGSGKSTLSRILAGVEAADAGELQRRRGVSVAYLSQQPELEPELSARQLITEGLRSWSEALARYEAASASLAAGEGGDAALEAQAAAALEVERLGGWQRDHEVQALLTHLSIPQPDAPVAALSGGERRRVALARLLISRPDLALLDEPTNHLDVETITWLEEYLLEQYPGALLLVTHDRYLLDRVATRTLELERGKLYDYDGGYETFLQAKAERLAHEARTEQNRQNFLRRELEWLRRQPKARGTKQKARIERALSAQASAPPPKEQHTTLSLDATRAGKTILELRDVALRVGERALVSGVHLLLTQGDRVGIVGRNGTGKTTLLRAIVGQLAPAAGEIVRGANTKIAYFDQERGALKLEESIYDNVAAGSPKVELGGEVMDVHRYLERFAFSPHQQRQPVGSLSGGERARVALARLLRQPANLVVFDEPTNDLDVATLGSLEDLLTSFGGTALVVTHDRWFLDRVATSILHFDGAGAATHYPGNHEAFLRLRAEAEAERHRQLRAPAPEPKATRPAALPAAPAGLNRKERVELDALPELVDAAEQHLAALELRLAAPDAYAAGGEHVRRQLQEVEAARAEVERLTRRWEALEARR